MVFAREKRCFIYAAFKHMPFPRFGRRDSGTGFPEQAPPQKITKALSAKVTQACGEHLHSTAWAEIRAEAEKEASLSLPCRCFKAKERNRGPGNMQSVCILQTQQPEVD